MGTELGTSPDFDISDATYKKMVIAGGDLLSDLSRDEVFPEDIAEQVFVRMWETAYQQEQAKKSRDKKQQELRDRRASVATSQKEAL
jgi:hypothetical protein